MANDVHSCSLFWEIREPFIPFRRTRTALFYEGNPDSDPVRWKMVMQPVRREISNWVYLFTLECDNFFDEESEVINAIIHISLNGQLVDQRYELRLLFLPRSEFVYSFLTHFNMRPSLEVAVLFVAITLRLPGDERTVHWDRESDIIGLSNDLGNLYTNPVYTNMRLISRDHVVFHVHSYIIRARWNKFFRMHFFDPTLPQPMYQINVSGNVLHDILTYIYSGNLDPGWPNWANPAYVADLFSVINNYHLYHLYKVLVNDDDEQRRVTFKSGNSYSFMVRRQQILDLPIGDTWPWPIYEELFNLTFEFQLLSIENVPWLAYRVLSRDQTPLFVQVNLQVLDRLEDIGTAPMVHEADYELRPRRAIQFNVFSLTCPQTFGNLYRNADAQYWIRCIFKFTDHAEINLINSISNNRQGYLLRCSILCDHMQRLMRNEFQEADLTITAPENLIYRTYKAIFAVRVPHWWRVFENIEPPNMPDAVRLSLLNEVIPFILTYICTGRHGLIPDAFLEDIEDFARRGNCESLQNFVVRHRHLAMLFGDR